MAEPGRQAVAGIVLHRALFGGGAKRFRNALGSVIVVGRNGHADMAIVENRVVLAVNFPDQVQRLRDEERLKAVTRHEGDRALEEVEPRTEERTYELQSLMRISYASFCLKKTKKHT